MGELTARFVLGGSVVTVFAVLGDVLRPRTFAGIFAAAPSVALASLLLSYNDHGTSYVSTEGRSMMAGATALLAYSAAAAWVVRRDVVTPWLATLALWTVWLSVAFGLWFLFLR